MRYIGLDVGRDFAHAAVVEGTGSARKLGRLRMGEELAAFAATLGPDDAVALEASGNTWALVELLGRHAGRVVVSNPLRTRAIADAKRKTDDIDAATLAELLAADYLPAVWIPDEATRRLRRIVAHRAGLVRDRTATRNRVSAILGRRLVRSPLSDPFGSRGRAWLAALELPPDERLALDSALRLNAVLDAEVDLADRAIATALIDDPRVRHLLTIPGIGLVTAAGILAVVGDIGRFPRPAKLVSYLGLDPQVRQSGDRPAHPGHISRAGQAHARGLVTEAAHAAVRAPGPLATFFLRLAGATRRGHRHRRGGTQARGAGLAPAHEGRGLPRCPTRPGPGQATGARPARRAGDSADAAVAPGSDWFKPRPGPGKAARRGRSPSPRSSPRDRPRPTRRYTRTWGLTLSSVGDRAGPGPGPWPTSHMPPGHPGP